MGTRHLIAVVKGGEYKVAQYGQWDGYLDGQGRDIAECLCIPSNYEALKRNVDRCTFMSKDRIDEIYDEIDENGWGRWRYLSRDTGSDILKHIIDAGGETVELIDESKFGEDSLFCEWAYVIDLDNDILEIYEGFNKSYEKQGERFKIETGSNGGYYGCSLYSKLNINECLKEEFWDLCAQYESENEDA